jgi:hypothetical protein
MASLLNRLSGDAIATVTAMAVTICNSPKHRITLSFILQSNGGQPSIQLGKV